MSAKILDTCHKDVPCKWWPWPAAFLFATWLHAPWWLHIFRQIGFWCCQNQCNMLRRWQSIKRLRNKASVLEDWEPTKIRALSTQDDYHNLMFAGSPSYHVCCATSVLPNPKFPAFWSKSLKISHAIRIKLGSPSFNWLPFHDPLKFPPTFFLGRLAVS